MNPTFRFGFRDILVENVVFNPVSQRFTYGSADVTDYLSGEQKRSFPDYDVELANQRASESHSVADGRGIGGGSTDTLALFAEGVTADASSLATATRNFIGIGPENEGKGSPLLKWALAIGVLVILWKVGVFDYVRKKINS